MCMTASIITLKEMLSVHSFLSFSVSYSGRESLKRTSVSTSLWAYDLHYEFKDKKLHFEQSPVKTGIALFFAS